MALRIVLSFVFAAVVLAESISAQLPRSLEDQLAAIYQRNEFTADTFGPVVWLDGGARFVAPVANRGLVVYTSATGADEILVSTADLTPAGGRPLTVSGFSVSVATDKVLIFTNTRKVWRQNTRGDYWVFDRQKRSLKKLGGEAPEASLMFAKLTSDGMRAAYVRDNNIYVEEITSGRIVQLTRDGGADVINGTSDWVNEEELSIRDAFRWSPDGRSIAYWQFDTTGVGRMTLINNTDAQYPRVMTYAYPKAGTRNSATRVGVVAAAGGPTTWMKAPGDPREHYVPRMQWIDSQMVAFQYSNRAQTENRMLLGAAATGTVTEAFHESGKAWLDSIRALVGDSDADPAQWFNDKREFTWLSDRDGWTHVYAVDRTNGRDRLLTSIDGDVLEVRGIDEHGNRLYFIASPTNATQRYLYSVPLNGPTETRRVTPASYAGTNGYDISPDGRWALHTHSRFDSPPTIDLIALPEHQPVRRLVDNTRLRAKVASLVTHPVEFVSVRTSGGTGGTGIDGYVLKPRSFDANRMYPVIVYVYGEVWGLTVTDRWLGAPTLFQRALADEGYVVVSFDNRGTPAPKGAAWRKGSYKAVNHQTAADQAAALRALAASRAYLDLSRVGIYGTSGGGSNTLHAMFREPDLYKVGVAMAPLPDQRLYDTIYQERYSGLPDVDRESYDKGSAITFAEGLRGKLLLIHGTGDDNVHLQGTERLVNRLIELGKDFDEIVYPNRTHAISEGAGTPLHRWRTVARYFIEQLPPTLASDDSRSRP